MKNTFLFVILFSCAFTLAAVSSPLPTPKTRPDYIPSTPGAEKPISGYTPADVLGVVSTADYRLPPGHAFLVGNRESGLKANWPGAKVPTNIDAMIEFVLAAPPRDPSPFSPKSRMVKRTYENVIFVIQQIMDVPDSEKADALVRVVNAQTDPQKAKHAKAIASLMFEDLLDPRLLAYEMEGLDDPATYKVYVYEGEPKVEFQARWNSKKRILNALNSILKMNIDETPFRTTDEASNCAALKAWLTANWATIGTKCAELRANPERKRSSFLHQPWDARW